MDNEGLPMDWKSYTPKPYLQLLLKYFMPADLVRESNVRTRLIYDVILKDVKSHIKYVGSSMEGLAVPPHDNLTGDKITVKKADHDQLWIIPNTFRDQNGYQQSMYRIRDCPTLQANYAYLEPTDEFKKYHRDLGTSVEIQLLPNLIPRVAYFLFRKDNYSRMPQTSVSTTGIKFHGPAVTEDIDTPHSKASADKVLVFEFKKWPDAANEWRNRHRPSGWPSNEMQSKILKSGINMAAVGKRGSPTQIYEWRYSFNNAEKILAHSFNKYQCQLYAYMKLFRMYDWDKPDGLSSFLLKVVFFWIFERVPQDYFNSTNMASMFLLILDEMICALAKRKLPNYFIPTVNMLALIPEDHLKTLHAKICYVRMNPVSCLLALDNATVFIGRPKISSVFKESLDKMAEHPRDRILYKKSRLCDLNSLLGLYLANIKKLPEVAANKFDKRRHINTVSQLIDEILQDMADLQAQQHMVSRTQSLNVDDVKNIMEQTAEPSVIAYVLLAVSYYRENKPELKTVRDQVLSVLGELEAPDYANRNILRQIRAEIVPLVKDKIKLNNLDIHLEEFGAFNAQIYDLGQLPY